VTCLWWNQRRPWQPTAPPPDAFQHVSLSRTSTWMGLTACAAGARRCRSSPRLALLQSAGPPACPALGVAPVSMRQCQRTLQCALLWLLDKLAAAAQPYCPCCCSALLPMLLLSPTAPVAAQPYCPCCCSALLPLLLLSPTAHAAAQPYCPCCCSALLPMLLLRCTAQMPWPRIALSLDVCVPTVMSASSVEL
jgi:hypothetical protein